MCIEDVTIARQKRSRHYVSSAALDIPGNPARLAVTIAADSGGQCQLSILNAAGIGAAGPVTGEVVLATISNIAEGTRGRETISLDDVGNCLTGPLRITTVAGEGNAYLTEVYLEVDTPYNPTLTKLPK